MSLFSKLLVGVAGASAAAVAFPASAQTYYPPTYPPTYNQGYGQPSVVGQVLNSVLGGGRYGTYGQGNDRVAVDQCARAVEVRVSQDNRRGVYGRWNNAYGNQGYGNQAYNQAYGHAQVVGITGVERKRNGLKVSGLIDTRMGGNGQYNQYGQYGQYGQATPGYPNQAYPNQAYPNQAYPNQGYPNQGYGNQAYNAAYADLRFNCRVDYRGQVTELNISRNRRG